MKTEKIAYEDQGALLEGFLTYDSHWKEKRPAVILCHAWRGRDDFVCEKAEEMTRWGYAGFALDMYGKGILGNSKEENSALMNPFIEDRKLLQRRLWAALDTVKRMSMVDPSRIAAIGFCFGGLCALDFARSGADLRGAISVHGLLSGPGKSRVKSIKAKILALHGHDDPMVPPEQVAEFEQEMTAAKADWQIHIYGGTMHAFTHPAANDPDFGTVYNPVAAKRAWQSIQNFLQEIFV